MNLRHNRIVASFDELIATPFAGEVNALCWPRVLPGDFQAVVDALQAGDGITTIDDDDLRALTLSPQAAVARDVLLADQVLLRAQGLVPSLDCINGYARDVTDAPIATDVYSFHADRAPVPAETYLCTYIGAPSEAIPNEMAVRRIDDAVTRAALLRDYGGADDAGFTAWLSEHSFDLHFQALPGAEPYSLGIGNLWRIAIAYPGAPVLPCIHRAPLTPPDSPSRLLLIS